MFYSSAGIEVIPRSGSHDAALDIADKSSARSSRMKHLFSAAIIALLVATTALSHAEREVEIKLASSPKSVFAEKGKALELSAKRASCKFRIVAGIADATAVSLEHVGSKGYFVRHANFQLYLHERRDKLQRLFNSDATFRMISLEPDKVRFESFNYPGRFIAVRDDGIVILSKDPSPANSTFVLK